jgi:hypothetical protein
VQNLTITRALVANNASLLVSTRLADDDKPKATNEPLGASLSGKTALYAAALAVQYSCTPHRTALNAAALYDQNIEL